MMLESFNQMAAEFLQTVLEIYPEHKDVLTIEVPPDTRKALDFIMSTIGDKTKMITAKDETLFDGLIIRDIDVHDLWARLTVETKNELWEKLSALVLVGTTINNTPTGLMTDIEQLATEFGSKIEDGNVDITSMMGEIFSRVKDMDLSQFKNMANMSSLTDMTDMIGMHDMGGITDMMGEITKLDPRLLNTVGNLMRGGDEPDILSILENARPPPRVAKKSNKKKHNRRK